MICTFERDEHADIIMSISSSSGNLEESRILRDVLLFFHVTIPLC